MSTFKTRRATPAADPRSAVVDLSPDEIEGVTLAALAAFVAHVGRPGVTVAEHEAIAVGLGFPAGRYDLIRNAWLSRVYASPMLGKEFGTRLDEARATL